MAHSRLLDLPMELLLLIVGLNGGRNDELTLYCLCLTCQDLRNIAQPILFSRFELSPPDVDNEGISPEIRIIIFCRTVLSRQDLASATKLLRLDIETEWAMTRFSLSLADKIVFSRAAIDKGLPVGLKWGFMKQDTWNLSAIVFLLLAQLPNVVEFVFNPDYQSIWLSMFAESGVLLRNY
jgi:hypothetical protein